MIDQIIAFNKNRKSHPLVPKDIVVRGFIIDSETGASIATWVCKCRKQQWR